VHRAERVKTYREVGGKDNFLWLPLLFVNESHIRTRRKNRARGSTEDGFSVGTEHQFAESVATVRGYDDQVSFVFFATSASITFQRQTARTAVTNACANTGNFHEMLTTLQFR